jgi:hypothetical protein
MKVNDILLEHNYTEPQLSEQELLDCAKAFVKRCKIPLDKPLWRKTGTIGKAQTKLRSPQGNTKNIWPWLHSKKEWKEYPDRFRSIFCSTSPNVVYGGSASEILKAIYPVDVDKFAQCGQDFNTVRFSRDDTARGLADDMSFGGLENLLSYFRGSSETRSSYSVENAIARHNDWCAGKFQPDESPFSVKVVIDSDSFTPTKLKCKLVRFGQLKWSSTPDEVWFEGLYLAIPHNQLNQFKDMVKALKNEN